MGEKPKKIGDNSIDLVSINKDSDQHQMELQSINSFYALAQESFINKSYRIAIIYLRKILQIDNAYLPAYKLIAKIFQLRGQLKKSAEILRQAIDINFRDAELHYQLGYLYYLEGNKTGFARECTKALVVNPSYSKAFYALALLHFENGRYSKAKQELEKCLSLNPNDSEAHMLLAKVALKDNNYTQARTCIENVLKFEPHNEKANYYLAEIAFFMQDYRFALQQYLQLGNWTDKTKARIFKAFDFIKEKIDARLKQFPKDTETMMELASLYYQVGQLTNAKKTLQQILKIDPALVLAKINYGLMLIHENHFLKGIKLYQEVLKEAPLNNDVKLNLKRALEISQKELLAQNTPAALKELLEILMLTQQFDAAILIMLELNTKEYAREILQQVADKNLPAFLITQGGVLHLLGETQQALYLLEKQEKEKIKSPWLYYYLGLIAKQQQNLVSAYKYFEQVNSFQKNFWFVAKELTNITHLELANIEKSLAAQPNNLKLNSEYLDLLILLGRYAQALRHLEKIKTSDLQVVDFSDKFKQIYALYEKELEAKLEYNKPAKETYLDLAQVYLYKKRYNEAFLLMQNALQVFPSDRELQKYYLEIVEQNIQIYETMLKTNKSTMVFYNLAVFYAVKDQKAAALLMLSEAVAKDKRLAIQARYEEAFKKYRQDNRFRLITIIEGEDKNIYQMQD